MPSTISPKIETRSVSFSRSGFKSAKDGTFEAIVSVYGNVDFYGERVIDGAFAKSIEDYKNSGRKFKVLWNHNHERPIGVVTEIESLSAGSERLPEEIRANGGLWVKGTLAVETTEGDQALKHMNAGTYDEWSIGFMVRKGGDRIGDDGIRELTDLELFEVSTVLVGANRQTGTIGMKGLGNGLDFNEHAAGLAECIDDFIDRAAVRTQVRMDEKAGRVLSAQNAKELEALAGTLGKARKTILAMLAAAKPNTDAQKGSNVSTTKARAYLLSQGIEI